MTETMASTMRLFMWLIMLTLTCSPMPFWDEGPPQDAIAERPDSGPKQGDYVLGPDDQVTIQSLHVGELANKQLRIDMSGDVTVPMAGRVHMGGRTRREVEQELDRILSAYILEPQVSVTVTEFRSQPVSVIGAVNNPGVHQVQGRKTLAEMLSVAGGPRQDAGYLVSLTRPMMWGKIPVAQAEVDPEGGSSTAEFRLKDILTDSGSAAGLLIMPHDIISVPKASMVYVIGDVHRPGGFILGEHETVSVLQALSLAEGWERTASPQNARIIRRGQSGSAEVAVDIRRVLRGQAPDQPLHGEDILFIPGSTGKRAALRALETAIQTGSGVVIWRSGR